MERTAEVSYKLDLVRSLIKDNEALRLRGIDWFAWITAGASSSLSFTAETGIAELLITQVGAWLLTDNVEAKRLQAEEVTANFIIQSSSWPKPHEREHFVREMVGRRSIVSDRPLPGERQLPEDLLEAKQTLNDLEVQRYQTVGRFAAEAMTEAMLKAIPGWTEWELAGAGAEALLSRGLQPVMILAAGEKRLQMYRHPTPSHELLGNSAMLRFCARMHGLCANITRYISFGKLPTTAAELHHQVREMESCALKETRPGAALRNIFAKLADCYKEAGFPDAMQEHQLGGTTGYLPCETVATPSTDKVLHINSAVAWSPGLPGAMIEDTFVITDHGLITVTFDRNWPLTTVSGIERPLVMEL